MNGYGEDNITTPHKGLAIVHEECSCGASFDFAVPGRQAVECQVAAKDWRLHHRCSVVKKGVNRE